MGAPRPAGLRTERPELARACPVAYCKGLPGARCTSPRGRALASVHPSRAEAAAPTTTKESA